MEVSVSLRELSGNILLFAICATLLLMSLLFGLIGYVPTITLSLGWVSVSLTVIMLAIYALMVRHYAKVY